MTEDVGDEGEEEKEHIAYNINTDIHYGLKSNRYWVFDLLAFKQIFLFDQN